MRARWGVGRGVRKVTQQQGRWSSTPSRDARVIHVLNATVVWPTTGIHSGIRKAVLKGGSNVPVQ